MLLLLLNPWNQVDVTPSGICFPLYLARGVLHQNGTVRNTYCDKKHGDERKADWYSQENDKFKSCYTEVSIERAPSQRNPALVSISVSYEVSCTVPSTSVIRE